MPLKALTFVFIKIMFIFKRKLFKKVKIYKKSSKNFFNSKKVVIFAVFIKIKQQNNKNKKL